MSSIPKLLVLLLLMLYVVGTSELQIIHSIIHDHGTKVVHSDQQEQDPCHRSMYHDDKSQGCAHDSHLIALDKCKMCDLVCNIHPALLNEQSGVLAVIDIDSFGVYQEHHFFRSVFFSSSRAPPLA